MHEILLDAGIILDLCLEEETAHHATACRILRVASESGGRVWAFVGDRRWLLTTLADRLASRATAAARLAHWTAGLQWLAALAEDATLFTSPNPELEPLRRALERLPKNRLLVTRDPDQLRELPAAMDPATFLQRPAVTPDTLFVNLAAQQDRLRPALERNIHAVLHHGQYIMGPEVKRLEEALATFAGVERCISCSSGTDALVLALLALGIGPGDAVFVPAFTFMATAEAVAFLGAEPRFIDIDPDTCNMDPARLDQEIQICLHQGRFRPRCVMPVDLFGLPADYPAIGEMARRYGLFVLSDSAQGFGGTLRGKPVSVWADALATSFFPAKPLGCYGDGGAVLTNDTALADLMVSLREHGKGSAKYDNVRIGINGRMDTLQAAILLPKLAALPKELATRRMLAARYTERLQEHVQTPRIPEEMESAWAQYGILVDQRDALQKQLQAKNIPTAIYYPKPLPSQTVFAAKGYPAGNFPVATAISQRILHLPISADLRLDEVDRICDAVISALQAIQNGAT